MNTDIKGIDDLEKIRQLLIDAENIRIRRIRSRNNAYKSPTKSVKEESKSRRNMAKKSRKTNRKNRR